jgi:hypothetical protein
VMFYSDYVEMCEDFAPNLDDKRTGCCITTTHLLTLLLHQGSVDQKQHDCRPHPPYFSLFPPDLRKKWETVILTQLRWSRQNRRRCWTPHRTRLPDCIYKIAGALGRGYTSERGIFRGPKLVFDQMAAPIPEIENDCLYFSVQNSKQLLLCTKQFILNKLTENPYSEAPTFLFHVQNSPSPFDRSNLLHPTFRVVLSSCFAFP